MPKGLACECDMCGSRAFVRRNPEVTVGEHLPDGWYLLRFESSSGEITRPHIEMYACGLPCARVLLEEIAGGESAYS